MAVCYLTRCSFLAALWFPLWWGTDGGQHLRNKRQKLFERGEARGLARHHVLNPPCAPSLPDIGLCPKLHDKSPVRGKGGRDFCRRLHASPFSDNCQVFLAMVLASCQNHCEHEERKSSEKSQISLRIA